MELTWIGIVVGVAGLALLGRSSTAMLCFMLFCTLFGGGAAFVLPALGYTSVQPASFALLFLIVSLGISALKGPVGVIWAIERNSFLALFVIYGVIGAYTLPNLFLGQIELAPMRVVNYLGELQGEPLKPSPQNTTQAVYLLGTLVTSICATIAARRERQVTLVVKTVLWISWIHIGFGILDVALNAAGAGALLDVFRNGNYGQLSQDVGTFHRISGVFPEPSAYATYAFGLFALTAELWMRNIMPRLSGGTATALLIIVLASTSATGIVAVGVYGPILAARIFLIRPPELAVSKALGYGGVAAAAIAGGLILMLTRPDFAQSIIDTFQGMLLGKAQSSSGIQRAFWARQGIDAFIFTHGIGVGPGSFRSSSLLTAILGSVGIFGATCFALHAWRLWNPIGARQREIEGGDRVAVSDAFGWGAVAGLIASIASAGSPDPGLLFGVCSGISLGYMTVRARLPGRTRGAPHAVRAPNALQRVPDVFVRRSKLPSPAAAPARRRRFARRS